MSESSTRTKKNTWCSDWFAALKGGNRREISFFLDGECAEIDAVDSGGQTALHFAVRSNDFTLAAFLVHHGANVNAVSKDAKTPLMMAALQENVILVHFLLHNGALAALPRIGQSKVAMDDDNVPKFLDWLQKQKSPHVTPRQKVEEALRNSWRPQK